MRFNASSVALVVGFCSSVSCTSVYRSYKESTPHESKSGIPIYQKSNQCNHETVYQESWYRVSRSIYKSAAEQKTGKPLTDFVCLTQATYEMSPKIPLLLLQAAGLGTDGTEDSSWLELKGLSECAAVSATADGSNLPSESRIKALTLLSNKVVASAVIDYSAPLYVNVLRPWIGKSEVTLKLNGDGLLTETSAKLEDTTAETVLAAIPISSYLTNRLGLSAKIADAQAELEAVDLSLSTAKSPFRELQMKARAAAAARREKSEWIYQVETVPQVFLHSLSATFRPKSLPCPDAAPLRFGPCAITSTTCPAYLMAEAKQAGNGGGKKEGSKNKITLTGEIGLPEAKPE